MAPKAQDRLAALRQKAQALTRQAVEPAPDQVLEQLSNAEGAAAAPARVDPRAFFGAVSLEQLAEGRQIKRVPVTEIAPNLDPTMRQPRLLPLPQELVVDGEPVQAYRGLVRELLEFGRSLTERQIQPILVYPGTSAQFPAARYLILVGHRRWTAASLVGIEFLDVIEVGPPTRADRVVVQYRENKDRSEFSDMELVWSLMQMKEALGPDGTWDEVEQHFNLGRARRQQLMRMASFTSAQQYEIARLRLQETQARALHEAVRRATLNERQVNQVLARLAVLADERAAKDGADSANAPRIGVDAPTVARLVAGAQRATDTTGQKPTRKWIAPLRAQLTRARTTLQRTRNRVVELNSEDAQGVIEDVTALMAELHTLAQAMHHHFNVASEAEGEGTG